MDRQGEETGFRHSQQSIRKQVGRIPPEIAAVIKGILLPDAKMNVTYDLVRDPLRYMESTLRIS